MAKQSEISVAKFESIGNKLFQVDLFTVKETDEAKIKYDDFLKFVVLKIFEVLRIFFLFSTRVSQPTFAQKQQVSRFMGEVLLYFYDVSWVKCRGERFQYQ